jgi:hypothetical protein
MAARTWLLSPRCISPVAIAFHFAEFVEKKGCRDTASCKAYIKEFVPRWLEQHGAKCFKVEVSHLPCEQLETAYRAQLNR